ncbi:MAG: class I SAM-dependent methyltransferase [Chloroflexi bacterium]|nr:class I SAM-dependent methyltransferase [Chloroflexota bacterium]
MMSLKNNHLLDVLVCPECHAALQLTPTTLLCMGCGKRYDLAQNAVLFTTPPSDINPSELRERGEGRDTPWRHANSVFLRNQIEQLSSDALLLDVGAGRGDFLPFYEHLPHVLLDVYPYPEVDVVCDLTKLNPFHENSLDVVLLMNVLEHVVSPLDLLRSMHAMLKPHGRIIIAIPFYLKIHQAPLDFQRLTHFALRDLAQHAGYSLLHLEGFYDPCGVIEESLRYYRFWGRAGQGWLARKFGAIALALMQVNLKLLRTLSVHPFIGDPFKVTYPAPMGYHLVLEKN